MNRPLFDEDDLAFERGLLSAGQAEPLPHDRTDAALLRFAAGLAALPGAVIGGAPLAGPIASATGSAWMRFFATAKWVALGAIVGGVATFFWVQHSASPGTAIAHAVPAVVEPAKALAAETPPPAGNAPPHDATPLTATSATQPSRTARASASASSTGTPKPASDLAAEVAALDGIRTALAIGAWSDAEQQLTRYRQHFANGALRTEAEVLTIEALRAQGREQAAASAAERFITQHPRDPQLARVRALTE